MLLCTFFASVFNVRCAVFMLVVVECRVYFYVLLCWLFTVVVLYFFAFVAFVGLVVVFMMLTRSICFSVRCDCCASVLFLSSCLVPTVALVFVVLLFVVVVLFALACQRA